MQQPLAQPVQPVQEPKEKRGFSLPTPSRDKLILGLLVLEPLVAGYMLVQHYNLQVATQGISVSILLSITYLWTQFRRWRK